MRQLTLFEPRTIALSSLTRSIERCDWQSAAEALEKYRGPWGNEGIVWEEAVVTFFLRHADFRDLEEAAATWAAFESTPDFANVPDVTRAALEQGFFSSALETLAVRGETRTAAGISVGQLWHRAGKLAEACLWLEEELGQLGEDAVVRLRLGNSYYRCQERRRAP